MTTDMLRKASKFGVNTINLSAPTLLRTVSILAVTVALGRSANAGSAAVGQFSVLLAFVAIAQSVAIGGISGAALHKLVNAIAAKWLPTVQMISAARFILLPLAFTFAFVLYRVTAFDGSLTLLAVLFFFAGYAVGTYDVGELIFTSRARFADMAARRSVVIALISVPKVGFGLQGNLDAVLILQGLELALCQLVMLYSRAVPVTSLVMTRFSVVDGFHELSRVRLLWLSSMIAVLGMRVDVLLVAALLGNSAAGQYATASRLVEAASIVAASVGTLALKDLSKHSHAVGDYAAALTRNARLALVTGGAATLVSAAVSPILILSLYGADFKVAAQLSVVYSATLFVIFFRQLVSKIMIVESAFRISFTSNFLSVLISIGAAYILIPTFGLWGAVLATLLAYYGSVLFGLGISNRGRSMLAGSLLASVSKASGMKAADKLIGSRC